MTKVLFILATPPFFRLPLFVLACLGGQNIGIVFESFSETLEQTCWALKDESFPFNDGDLGCPAVSFRGCFEVFKHRSLELSTQIGDHQQQRFQCNWCRVSGFVSFLAVFCTPFC